MFSYIENLILRSQHRGSKLCLSSLILLFTLGAYASTELVQTGSIEGSKLRSAFLEDDIDVFEKLLGSGADPTELFDNSQLGWVMCAATLIGREKYLRKILNHGYDPNYRRSNITSELSIPLSCAVRSGNLGAIRLLVSAGADPSNTICIECSNRYPTSVLSEAVLVNKYTLAVWLFENGVYSNAQIDTVKRLIEFLPFPLDSPEFGSRQKLVELMISEGVLVVPWSSD